MTNYEKIKQMSIDEMAEFLDGLFIHCITCAFKFRDDCKNADCVLGHKQWLESEAEE